MSYSYPDQSFSQPQKRSWLHNWSPALAWLLVPLAFSIFTNFGLRPSWSPNARWVGFFLLAGYGFFNWTLRRRWKLTSFDYFAFVIFALIFLVSIIFSEFLGIYKALSCLLVYFYLTWGVGSLIERFEDASAITEKFLSSVILLLGIGLVGNLSGIIPPIAGAPSGIFFNPNGTASCAIMSLPISVWFLSLKQKSKILKYIPIVIILVAIVLSKARTPWVGIFAFTIYSLLCWQRYRRKSLYSTYGYFAILFSLVIFAYILFADTEVVRTFLADFWESLQDPAGGITSYRTSVLWPLYITEIKQSFASLFFGHGWGSEETFLIQSREVNLELARLTNIGTAHSAYIGLTYQIGLMGSVLIFGSLWFLVIKTFWDASKAIDRERFQFRLAVSGMILVALCTALFETGVYNMGGVHAVPTWFAVYMATRFHSL